MNKTVIFQNSCIAAIQETALESDVHFTEFHEIIRYYMKQEEITIEELSEQTGIPERIIKQMRSQKESKHRFDLRYLVAISIGLHMIFIHSWYLIYIPTRTTIGTTSKTLTLRMMKAATGRLTPRIIITAFIC